MIKNALILSFAVLSIWSCSKGKKQLHNYVTISGLIANNEATNIRIITRGYEKQIMVNLDGTFKDTLKVPKTDFFNFNDGKNKSTLHLKNGNELDIQYDYLNFNKTVKLKGVGSETTTYLIQRKKYDDKVDINNRKAFYLLEPKEFSAKIKKVESSLAELLVLKNIDSTLKVREVKRNNQYIAFLKKNYAKKHSFLSKFKKGATSPKFFNYENYKGGKTSLDDFKGKYVYIDVWATWCGPCKREIPQLKMLTKEYADNDIVFISISVDNGRGYKNDKEAAKKAWRKMIEEKEMKGVQLYADKAWNSSFIKELGIRSIPRFILIDPEGKIVDVDALRPSNRSLKGLLNSLLKK